jgi:hypothetical protein
MDRKGARKNMRIPVNLLAFLAVAGVFYLVVLPKRAAFAHDLIRTFRGGPATREDSLKTTVEARIVAELCPRADLSEYRPVSWTDFSAGGNAEASIIHAFTCDGQSRKFLFRMRDGRIAEIIDLR